MLRRISEDACVAPANIGEYGLSLLANIECEGLTIFTNLQ